MWKVCYGVTVVGHRMVVCGGWALPLLTLLPLFPPLPLFLCCPRLLTSPLPSTTPSPASPLPLPLPLVQVRPFLAADGGNVEVVDVAAGVVFVRLEV